MIDDMPLCAAQRDLRASRQALRALLVDGDSPDGGDEFPRSATMRLLFRNGNGAGIAMAVASAVFRGFSPGARRLIGLVPITALTRLLLHRRRPKPEPEPEPEPARTSPRKVAQ